MINLIKKIKDPVSCLTHLVGAILSIIGLVALVIAAVKTRTPWHTVGFSIFGASLILLYTASTVYHMLNISEEVNLVLKKIDNIMIFVLIAGTYTPICLTALRGPWGWTILSLVWAIAIIGVFLKIFWINVPRWASTAIYLIMGWLVIVAIYPLSKFLPVKGILLLATGGVMYTVGAVIYGLKKPNLNFKYFGFHEIFHIFVMAGSLSHFLLMYFLV